MSRGLNLKDELNSLNSASYLLIFVHWMLKVYLASFVSKGLNTNYKHMTEPMNGSGENGPGIQELVLTPYPTSKIEDHNEHHIRLRNTISGNILGKLIFITIGQVKRSTYCSACYI